VIFNRACMCIYTHIAFVCVVVRGREQKKAPGTTEKAREPTAAARRPSTHRDRRRRARAKGTTERTMAAAGYELRGVYGTEPYWPEKKLKICVTGAGGFIGSHLAKRLKEEGHHVVACDWKRNEHMEVRGRFRLDSMRGRRRRRRMGDRAFARELF